MVAALQTHGIRTLADLTVRIPRRRRWWTAIDWLGVAGARRVEGFFAAHPARPLIVAAPTGDVVPWEQLRVSHEVDGSHGKFRAPQAACLLNASNDYEAIQSWLSLHESAATQRTYRKEGRTLWAIVERGRALSSLTTDDAIVYRAYMYSPERLASVQVLTAVDCHIRARDEARFARHQVAHQMRDFFRLTQPTDGNVRQDTRA